MFLPIRVAPHGLQSIFFSLTSNVMWFHEKQGAQELVLPFPDQMCVKETTPDWITSQLVLPFHKT